MGKVTQTAAWKKLQAHYETTKQTRLKDLFEADPLRQQEWSFELGDLKADFSRTHITRETLDLLVSLAKEQGLEPIRDTMFAGEKINNTENRAVLHTALRAQDDAAVMVDGRDVMPEIRAVQDQMEAFVAQVLGNTWRGATGRPIRDVVNIGIGGSDLGPRLVVSALRNLAKGPKVHFVANADAAEILGVLQHLDPATTLFVIVSKTFTTQETLLNAQTARTWLIKTLGETAVAQHFVAVSTNIPAVESFGIQSSNIFPMWDWVGGRYSLWSAVGLSIALSIGYDNFQKLLAGAARMDQHFLTAPLKKNIPVIMALMGVWYRNFADMPALAVLPYSERLRDLPRFLQQLDMESSGKSVTREGEAVDYKTGPLILGECGSVSQHSFHQWLHQGPSTIVADFIGVREDDLGQPEHHTILAAHRAAQIDALSFGRDNPDPARVNQGNKPVNSLSLARHDPENIGLLLALYEHKVFVQGVVWGINPFDQFGVELGKILAQEILKA